ncbi:hypothetical protein ACFORL_08415 [Legionella dresdenensis]|uniref:SecA family profile domain-containing protein n=1 Tax=Legionella dresdenensis TaxID=450200 RepID=A0ABV8CFX6_9GAMM
MIKIVQENHNVFEGSSINEVIEFFSLHESKPNVRAITRFTLELDNLTLSTEQVQLLADYIADHERKTAFRINISTANPMPEAQQEQLDNACLQATRHQFSQRHSDLINETVNVQAAPITRVRRTKINMLNGDNLNLSVQKQHQQQQQQQQQQQNTSKAVKKRIIANTTKEEITAAQTNVASARLGELIDKNTIEAKLGNYTRERYPEQTPDLLEIWDNLVSKSADRISNLNYKITHVQKQAMEIIIQFYPEFSYGLVYDNLPSGFYLVQTSDQKQVLCYSDAPEYQYANHPLRITLESKTLDTLTGTYRQFLPAAIRCQKPDASDAYIQSALTGNNEALAQDIPNFAEYERRFHHLTISELAHSRHKEALLFFLHEIAGAESPRVSEINRMMQALNLEDYHYQGLAKILLHQGDTGVLVFLKKMVKLKNNSLFTHFNEVFLKDSQNYPLFLAENSLRNLDNLAAFDNNTRAWWELLTSQHQRSGARTEFNELFAAFNHFIEQNDKQGTKLTLSCPAQNCKHLKITLNRIEKILRRAHDKQEQMNCLEGLDFSADGACFASEHANYWLVSKQMELSANHESAKGLHYMASTRDGLYHRLLGRKVNYQTSKRVFYRYLGQQKAAFSFDIYQKIEQAIADNLNISLAEKKLYLYLAAVTLTGNNPVTKCTDPLTQFQQLQAKIQTIIARLNLTASNRLGSAPFTAAFEILTDCEEKFALSPEHITYLLTQIEESTENDNQLIAAFWSTLRLFAAYPGQATEILLCFKQRAEKDKEGYSKIKTADMEHHTELFSTLTPVLNAADMNESDKHAFTRFLACLDISFTEGTYQEIIELVTDIKNLDQGVKQPLLARLGAINILRSNELPDLNSIKNIINDVKAIDLTRRSSWGINQDINNSLIQHIPATIIGNEALKTADKDLLWLLYSCSPVQNLEKLHRDIENGIKDFSENFAGRLIIKNIKPHAEQVLALLMEYINAIKKETATLDELLAITTKIEQKLPDLLNETVAGLSIRTLLIKFVQAAPGPTDIKELACNTFKSGLLVDFYRPRIEEILGDEIKAAIQSLQTGNTAFNTWLTNHFATIPSLRMDLALKQFDGNLTTLRGFTNALIELKNTSEADFRKTINYLVDDEKYKLLLIPDFTALLTKLFKSGYPIAEQVTVIFQAIAGQKISSEQLKNVFDHIELLINQKSYISQETYHMLLQLMVRYSLKQQSLFPLHEVISLKQLSGLERKQADELFNSIVKVAYHAQNDAYPLLPQLTGKISSLITDKIADATYLVSFITLLLERCQQYNPDEINTIMNLIDALSQHSSEQLEQIITIINKCVYNSDQVNLNAIQALYQQLIAHTEIIPQIANLFISQPYPPIQKLTETLAGGKQEVEYYINHFDSDPFGLRQSTADETSADILSRQFASDRILDAVTQIKQKADGSYLTAEQQFELTRQLAYINALGKDTALIIEDREYSNLIQASRKELSELAHKLSQPCSDEKEQLHRRLQLLAVMRELFYRSTGILPHTTQLLSVLLSTVYSGNLTMEIQTGEGKSIITPLLAAMQWFEQQGKVTVNVCTANRGLIDQDYFQKGAVNFFQSLQINSAVIADNSPAGSYCIGGINYSTIADLSLYCSRARLEGEALNKIEDGRELASDLILDEIDKETLDSKTLFNLSIAAKGADQENPYTWLYPLINQFIDLPSFKRLPEEDRDAWSASEDLHQLKIYLYEQTNDYAQKELLQQISNQKFDKWLDAACIAKGLQNGVHYIIAKQNDDEQSKQSEAVPLIQNSPQYGATFSNGVQQFLHARLQKDEPQSHFVIEPELLFVASESSRDLIIHYRENGRIIGITGTAGTTEELIEQESKFGLKAIAIPRHNKRNRQKLETIVSSNDEQQLEELKTILLKEAQKKPHQTPPSLLINNDIKAANKMYGVLSQTLAGSGLIVQIITGEETEAERRKRIENAGLPNYVTVTTSLSGRGVDIKPQSESGLFVIQTYLAPKRDTRQFIGRCARNGMAGRYLAIFSGNDFLHKYDLPSLQAMNSRQRKQAITALQKQMAEEAAVERHFVQEVAAIQQIFVQQFEIWQYLMLRDLDPVLKERTITFLLSKREEMLTGLADLWQQCLDSTDPEKKQANLYVRRNNAGELEYQELNKALKQFEDQAIDLWHSFSTELETKYNTLPMAEYRSSQELLQYIQHFDPRQELDIRHTNMRQQKREIQAENRSARNHAKYALDPEGAILHFDNNNLELAKRQQLAEASALSAFRLLKNDFDEVLQQLPKKHPLKNKLTFNLGNKDVNTLFDTFASNLRTYNHDPKLEQAMKYKMQPVAMEFIALCNRTQKQYPDYDFSRFNDIRQDYINDATAGLINYLEKNLAWAKKENQGFAYWFARSAVKTAAAELLAAIEQIKSAPDGEKNQALKNLYKILHVQQYKLKDLWIFFRNTRSVINKAIQAFANIEYIGALPTTFKTDYQEEAILAIHLDNFMAILNKLNQKHDQNKQWQQMTSELQAVMNKNNGLFVFFELAHCLSAYKDRFNTNKHLRPALQQLINEINAQKSKVDCQHSSLLQQSRYLSKKEEELQQQLKDIAGVTINGLQVRYGHTGFQEYFDLIIEGQDRDNLLPGFTRYKSAMLTEMLADLAQCRINIRHYQDELTSRKDYLTTHFSASTTTSLPTTGNSEIDALIAEHNALYQLIIAPPAFENIPPVQDWRVPELKVIYTRLENMSLKTLDANNVPFANISGFTEQAASMLQLKNNLEVQIRDKQKLIHALEKEIKETVSVQKQSGFARLKGLATQAQKKLVSAANGDLPPEKQLEHCNQELNRLTTELTKLSGTFENYKQGWLTDVRKQIDKRISYRLQVKATDIKNAIMERQNMAQSMLDSLHERADFLTKRTTAEKQKGAVITRRFSNLTELLEFQTKVQTLPKAAIESAPERVTGAAKRDVPRPDSGSSIKLM